LWKISQGKKPWLRFTAFSMGVLLIAGNYAFLTVERNKVWRSCQSFWEENLKHLDASAVVKIVAYGSRLAEDQQKLSTRFADVADIIREANFYAVQDGSDYIMADHVKRAIEEKIYRSNMIQEKIQEMIKRGDIGEIRFINAEYPQDWLATPLEKTGQKQAAWRVDPAQTGKSCCVGDIGSDQFSDYYL
jgi:hypothetical protein